MPGPPKTTFRVISPTGRRYVPNPERPPETLLFIGTGAIEGSWAPVTKALRMRFPNMPEGQENLAFASTINDLRHRANVSKSLSRKGLTPSMRKEMGANYSNYE